jgi:hypothetical protein
MGRRSRGYLVHICALIPIFLTTPSTHDDMFKEKEGQLQAVLSLLHTDTGGLHVSPLMTVTRYQVLSFLY